MSGEWKTVHFRCVACDEWAEVETVGEVIEGPRCPVCKKPMRMEELKQDERKLFDE